MKYSIIVITVLFSLNTFGQNYMTRGNMRIDTIYQYDTVKCIVQAYSPNNGLIYKTPQFFAIKSYVVRRIEKHNNYEGLIDPGIMYGFQYREWVDFIPVKFLLQDKTKEVVDVWAPNHKPCFMLKEW